MSKFIKKYLMISIVVIALAVTTSVITFKILKDREDSKKEEVKILDNLKVEVNTDVYLLSFVYADDTVEFISENELVDTSKLGEKELTIKYYNKKKQEKEITFTINIIDTIKPVIECEDVINVNVGTKPELTKNVKVTDNSNETIVPKIEGEYDYNKVGEYKLNYLATDMSGNEERKEFTLKVNQINIKNTGYYVYKTKETWYAMQFEKNGKATLYLNFCPGSVCGYGLMSGTYVIKDNQIFVTLTQYASETTIQKFDEPDKSTFIIKSETQIIDESKNVYTLQKNFY